MADLTKEETHALGHAVGREIEGPELPALAWELRNNPAEWERMENAEGRHSWGALCTLHGE